MNQFLNLFFLPITAILLSVNELKAQEPNFIIINCDDAGYADVQPYSDRYGIRDIETPNIDRLSAEGITFTNFYSAQAVCTASRVGLLTGCYPNRLGLEGALSPRSNTGINPKETTIAELLKEKGYTTAIFGKWHLGHHKKFLPLQNGFDEYLGLPYSNDMWPYHPKPKVAARFPNLPLIEGNQIINAAVDSTVQEQLTTLYTQKSIGFIKKNRDKPFFLYLAHTMPHVPLFVSDKHKGKSGKGLYGDVIMEIDWSVGEIMKALKESGIDDKTFVLFTSDNGPWLIYGNHAGEVGPLREGKHSTFEGGMRVFSVARWPSRIPKRSQCNIPAMNIDLLPTIASLADAPLPENKIDGKNIWSLFEKGNDAKSPQEAYYFYRNQELQAVLKENWKFHFNHEYLSNEIIGNDGNPGEFVKKQLNSSLFNLRDDIGETTDLSEKYPELVKQLKKLGEKFDREIKQNRRPAGKINQ